MPRKKPTAAPPPEPAKAPDTPESVMVTVQEVAKGSRPPSEALIQRMVDLLPVDEICQVIRNLIYATRTNAAGNEVSDTRAVEIGLKYWLGYVVGLPIQRQEILTREITEQDDPVARAAQSPATRRAIARTLEAQLEAIKAMDAEPETPDSK